MHTQGLHAHAAGTSCAVITGALFLACAIAYALAPSATISFFSILFHGIDFQKVAVAMTLGGAIGGFILSVFGAYVLTWAWVALYNRLLPGSDPATSTPSGSNNCCK